MARIKNPTSFSNYFGIAQEKLEELNVFNPILNVDSRLFIDPLLFKKSQAKEISSSGNKNFRQYFEAIISLLEASSTRGDAPWRAAKKLLDFREISSTCLGYGAATIHGNALGPALQEKILKTAKEIVDLGINNPNLFLLIPLLEENIGPDRISDMVTKTIIQDLANYTQIILEKLKIPKDQLKDFECITNLLSERR